MKKLLEKLNNPRVGEAMVPITGLTYVFLVIIGATLHENSRNNSAEKKDAVQQVVPADLNNAAEQVSDEEVENSIPSIAK